MTAPERIIVTTHNDISRTTAGSAIVDTTWRYENEGYPGKMLVAANGITCDATKSNTGRAISNDNKRKCFPIQNEKELWIKFDAYIVNGGSIRAYSDDAHNSNGVRIWHKSCAYKTAIWQNGTEHSQDGIVIDGLQRYILHMKSDATNGLIELYIDDDSKPACSFTGNINAGDAFSNFYMQSDDGNNVLYSNIIISNSVVRISENAKNENQWTQPVLTSNGDFVNDDFAVKKSNGSNYAYYLFDAGGHPLILDVGEYYDIHIKDNINVDSFYIVINDTDSFSGTLSYSDDGNTYTESTSFNKSDSTHYLVIDAMQSHHHYYRLTVTAIKASDNDINLSRININAVVNNEIPVTVQTHADTYTLKKLAPWRYENPGTLNQLTEDAYHEWDKRANIVDPAKTKTRTGIAYAVNVNYDGNMFSIPTDTEVWIKFDAWINPVDTPTCHRQISAGSWLFRYTSGVQFGLPYNGKTSSFDCDWYANNVTTQLDAAPEIAGLHSYKIHFIAGDAHGQMDVYIDNDDKPYISYTGLLQQKKLLSCIGIGTMPYTDADTDITAGSCISNVIISNQYVGIDEMAKDCVDHGRPAVSHGDTQRCISAEYTNHEDTSLAHYYAESEHGDVLKSVSTIETERADVKRMVLDDGKIPVTVRTDICRKTSGLLSSHVDVCRAVKRHIRTHNDTTTETARTDRFRYTTHNDIRAVKSNIVINHYDVTRNKLLEIKPFREGFQEVQSIDITLNELTLSDSVKLTSTLPLFLMEVVRGSLLDYSFTYNIESTSNKGITTEAQLMFDCDAILYQAIVYNEEETKTPTYAYDESDMAGLTIKEQQLARKAYQEDLLRKQNEWKQARKDRSWALSNMQRIASSLDKQLIWLADNYMTSNDWLGAGQTFSSIISALWGWTNRVPRRQVNVFVRGDKIYVLQRGHETQVVDLNSTAHTVPEIDREIVRTAWTRTADNDDASNAQGDGDDGNGTEHYFSGTKTNKGMSYEYADGLLMQAQGTDDQGNYTWIIYDYRQVGTYGDDAVQMTYKCEQTQGKGESTVAETYYSYASGWCTATKYVDGEYADSSEYQQSEVARVTEFSGSISLGSTGGGPGSKAALMVDRSFPVRSDDIATLQKLTDELQWMNRKTKETVKMDIYHCDHLIDFTDRLKFNGNEYYLVSNDAAQTQTELKQTITIVRWY